LFISDLRQVSPTNKTDRHDITEILLKVALNTMKVPIFVMFHHRGIVDGERIKISTFNIQWGFSKIKQNIMIDKDTTIFHIFTTWFFVVLLKVALNTMKQTNKPEFHHLGISRRMRKYYLKTFAVIHISIITLPKLTLVLCCISLSQPVINISTLVTLCFSRN
jgi:hypothetical protein